MISNLAIVYQLSIEVDKQKYIFIDYTFDLIKTKQDIIDKLKENRYENINLQNKFNELISMDPLLLELHFKFETLQALRPDYYPENVLPLLMEQITKSFVKTIKEDYKNKNKEDLLLN
ncbi:MAG: hypothetical protein ACLTK8_03400 [Paeniclostridium sp.]